MGTYLGLFNGSICMPQIVASLLSFILFPMLGSHQQPCSWLQAQSCCWEPSQYV